MEPGVVQTLKKYINTLSDNQRYLFPRSGRTYYRRFNKILERAGLPPMRFHDLRRTCIRLSRAMRRDIRFVMDLTGDTSRTIIREYEGYSLDEMIQLLEEKSITYHTMTRGDLKERRKRLSKEIGRIDELLKHGEIQNLLGVGGIE